jgi:signal transduction histidine kinase
MTGWATIGANPFGESVEVRVRDNGIGVPPENKDKLFQPFFTTEPTGENTGLGLSISYVIITHQHGATITVESAIGDFTEFTVRLSQTAASGGTRVGMSAYDPKRTSAIKFAVLLPRRTLSHLCKP